jgi:hypothetical protein
MKEREGEMMDRMWCLSVQRQRWPRRRRRRKKKEMPLVVVVVLLLMRRDPYRRCRGNKIGLLYPYLYI